MRASEILRQLADAIDKAKAPVQEFMEPEPQAQPLLVVFGSTVTEAYNENTTNI